MEVKSSTHDPLDVRKCACFNLRRAARLMAQAYDQSLRPSGLTNSQFTLLATAALEGPISITDMARQLGMDRTTLTRNLKLVKREGMLQLVLGTDARIRNVQLTARGRAALKRAMPFWQEAQARAVRALGGRRWDALLTELQAMGDLAGKLQAASVAPRTT